MDAVLEVQALHKRFVRRAHVVQANAGVDLRVAAGQVVGLLGHNGAGKTTLVNQVVGLTRPDSGSVTVCGVDTDACVLGVMFSLFDAGIDCCVKADLCWSSSGARLHAAGMRIIEQQFPRPKGKG